MKGKITLLILLIVFFFSPMITAGSQLACVQCKSDPYAVNCDSICGGEETTNNASSINLSDSFGFIFFKYAGDGRFLINFEFKVTIY